MTTRSKLWLKVAATILFTAVEMVTFRHSVVPAFAHATVHQILLAVGSQLSFAIGLGGLWVGRTRIAEDTGWASLCAFVLIVCLA